MYNFKEPDADPVNMRLNFKEFEEPPSLIDIKFPFPTDLVDWNNHNFNELQPYEFNRENYGYTLLLAVDNLANHGVTETWAQYPYSYYGIWFPNILGKQFLTGMQIWSVYGWRVAEHNVPTTRTDYQLTGFDVDLTPLTSSIFYSNRDDTFDTAPSSQYFYYLGRTYKDLTGYGGRGAFLTPSVDWANKLGSVTTISLSASTGYYIGVQGAWDTKRGTFQNLAKASAWPFGTNADPGVNIFLSNTFTCPTEKQDLIPSKFHNMVTMPNNPKTGAPV